MCGRRSRGTVVPTGSDLGLDHTVFEEKPGSQEDAADTG